MNSLHLTLERQLPLLKALCNKCYSLSSLYRYVAIVSFFLYFITYSIAQTKNIDSLKEKLDKTIGVERVDLLNLLSGELIHFEQNLALKYAIEADSLSKVLNYEKGSSLAYSNLGVVNKEAGNYDKSLQLLKKGLEISQEIDEQSIVSSILFETGIVNYRMGDYEIALSNFGTALKYYESANDKAWIASVKNEIGNVNLFQSNYSTALEYYFEALRIREDLKDFEKKAQTLNNIGLVYMYQKNLDEALNYLKQSLKLKEKYGDDKTIARSHNNVGLIYEEKGEWHEALDSYFKALEYLKPETDQSTITTVENNIGLVYNGMGEYDKALFYLKKSLKAKEEMGEKMDIAQSLTSIGKTYHQKADYQQAITYGGKGLEFAFEINSKKEIHEAASILYLAYEQFGDYKNALKYHVISEDYKDSLRNESQSKEIGRLEAKYAYDKQMAEEEKIRLKSEKEDELKQARQRIIIISSFALLGILFVAAIFYVKSLGNKNKVITQQNEELEAVLDNLQRTQTKLIQSEKMASLGILTAGIAHEINNPINFVYAGINSLLRDFEDIEPIITEISKIKPDSDNLAEKIKLIERLKEENYFDEAYQAIPAIISDIKLGADRTAEIIKGLRTFSSVDKGEMKYSDIHEGIEMSLLLLKGKFKNRIEIIKDYDKEVNELKCYPGKMNQVYLNLLSNAIDAISEEGKIWIKTKAKNGSILISVKDDGCGISKEDETKLYDPFYTTKPVGQGTGLGLSISYGIVQEHNGEIKVISEPGKGSEFIITLPTN